MNKLWLAVFASSGLLLVSCEDNIGQESGGTARPIGAATGEETTKTVKVKDVALNNGVLYLLSNPRPFRHHVRVVHGPVVPAPRGVRVGQVDPVARAVQARGRCRLMPGEIHQEVPVAAATVADAPGHRNDLAVGKVARNRIRANRATGASRTCVSVRCGSTAVVVSSALFAVTVRSVRPAEVEHGPRLHLTRAV